MLDWNDIRVFLAVADGGSTSAAARELGLNQTTVARRIATLEATIGLTLFERRRDGYRLTADGERLLPAARQAATALTAFGDAAGATRREIAGALRVTTTEMVASEILAPLLSTLRAQHPALVVELNGDDRRLDLGKGEADIAIRLGSRPDVPGTIRKRLGVSQWGLYCAADYARAHGVPQDVAGLSDHAIIGASEGLAHITALRWLREMAPGAAVAMRCNSVPSLIAAVRAGLGIGPLPRLILRDDPALLPILPTLSHGGDIWLVYPERLRHSAPLRVFVDAVTDRFAELQRRVEA